MSIVVDFGAEVAEYPVPTLWEVGVVNDTVAGIDLAVVSDPAQPDRWLVLSRQLDDIVVELEFRDGLLVDRVSGTRFDPARGVGIDGPYGTETLDHLPGFTSFPGDVDTFWPDARKWEP